MMPGIVAAIQCITRDTRGPRAGYRVGFSDGSVGSPSRIVGSERLLTKDMLVLDGVEIERAIAAFNRTAQVPVVYTPAEMPPARRVTGIFRHPDSQGFADQLAGAFGLEGAEVWCGENVGNKPKRPEQG